MYHQLGSGKTSVVYGARVEKDPHNPACHRQRIFQITFGMRDTLTARLLVKRRVNYEASHKSRTLSGKHILEIIGKRQGNGRYEGWLLLCPQQLWAIGSRICCIGGITTAQTYEQIGNAYGIPKAARGN